MTSDTEVLIAAKNGFEALWYSFRGAVPEPQRYSLPNVEWLDGKPLDSALGAMWNHYNQHQPVAVEQGKDKERAFRKWMETQGGNIDQCNYEAWSAGYDMGMNCPTNQPTGSDAVDLIEIAAAAAWKRDYPNGGGMYPTYESTNYADKEIYRKEVSSIVAALQQGGSHA